MDKNKLYTARWYNREMQGAQNMAEVLKLAVAQNLVLTELIGDHPEPSSNPVPVPKPSPVPTGSHPKGHYPAFAKVMPERMKNRGTYEKGWPKGAIVHFTAGRDGAEKTIRHGIENGYTFWCIQRDGMLACAHEAPVWGYHAGESSWNKIINGVTFRLVGSVSDDLIGIEINAAGRVKQISDNKYETWFKTFLTKDEVRFSQNKDNIQKGYYHVYTPEQEKALVETLFWLKDQRPDVFSFDFVLGHDEVNPKRKNDPGAALSMTMPEFRAFLKAEYAKRSV